MVERIVLRPDSGMERFLVHVAMAMLPATFVPGEKPPPRRLYIITDGEVTYDEWLDFWRNVMAQSEYKEEDVLEELDNMLEGGSWVDWNDGRTT